MERREFCDGLEKLMPKHMTTKIVGNYHFSVTFFDTFLQIVDATSDWTRFDFYAKRVADLRYWRNKTDAYAS